MIDGLTALDLTAGPSRLAGSILASFGVRVLRPLAVADGAEDDPRSWYENSGKEIWAPAARDAVVAALPRFDALLADETTEARWGLDAEALAVRAPASAVCVLTDFGLSGPRAGDAASELTVQAASGLMWTVGQADRAPLPVAGSQAAYQAAARGACAVLAALYSRAQGEPGGELIDVSRQEALTNAMSGSKDWWYIAQRNLLRSDKSTYGERLEARAIWEAADGFVCWRLSLGLGMPRNRTAVIEWMAEAGAAGELAGVPFHKLSTLEIAPEDLARWEAQFAAFFRTKTRAELFEAARERGFMMLPILSLDELAADEHVRAQGALQRATSGGHSFEVPVFPLRAEGVTRERRAPFAAGATLELPPIPRPADAAARASRPPLEGVRIVDFGWALAGPQTTRLLGLLGATVVKVETNTRLDATRASTPFVGKPSRNRGGLFAMHNNNKLGVTLDLAKAESREVMRRLVEWADAVSENFSGQRLEAWDLGFEVLHAWNPRLILLRSSTWGQRGPYARVPGYGLSLGGFAGYGHLTGWPDRDPTPPGTYTDLISPPYAAGALIAALIAREQSGEGIEIDVSQLECALTFLGPEIAAASLGEPAMRGGANACDPYPSGVFGCAGEQEWCALSVETRAQWTALCALVPGLDGVAELPEERVAASAPAVMAQLDAHCAGLAAGALVEALQAAGIAAAKVAKPEDLYADPQLTHRGHFVELEHPAMERFAYELPSFRFANRAIEVRRSPLIGEHNGEILGGALGYSEDEIAELYARGVLN
jgi:crotonobetainyl-CoA:carnitine CoA-transferase CaiB-like acyl-CoA transferase